MKITITLNYRNSSLEDKLIIWRMVQEVYILKPIDFQMKLESVLPQSSLTFEILLTDHRYLSIAAYLFKLGRKAIELQSLLSKPIKIKIDKRKYELNFDYIEQYVCDSFKVPVEFLQIVTRKREILQVRQIVVSFIKTYTKKSLQEIADKYPSKNNEHLDHSTILANIKVVNNLLATDKKFAKKYDEINNHFKMLTL